MELAPTAEMLVSLYKKANHMNLRRHNHNLFLTP